jgi:hypothetical protein
VGDGAHATAANATTNATDTDDDAVSDVVMHPANATAAVLVFASGALRITVTLHFALDIAPQQRAAAGVPERLLWLRAATATETLVEFMAPFDCRLKGVGIIPTADIAGVATNYTNVNVVNAGTDGAGTTELANKDFNATTVTATGHKINWVGTGLTTDLSEGTVIKIEYEKNGDGLLIPAGSWVFEIDGG